MARVLLLSQVVVYPPDAGPKVKTLQVLRHLTKQHEVTYCAFARTDQEAELARQLRPPCRCVLTVPLVRSRSSDLRFLLASLAFGDAFLLRRDERQAMHAAVRQLLDSERIEVIHVDQLNMMRFVPPGWPGLVFLDEHNAVWQRVERLSHGVPDPLRRWLLQREARLIQAFEATACRRSDLVLAVSEQDQVALRGIAGAETNIAVVPIAVNAAQYDAILATRQAVHGPQPQRLLTIGTMFSPPNSEGVAWWLRTGYEHLRSLCPDVAYDVVGPRPSAALRTLAARHRGVELHGYVADATPFWTGATALAVPLLSGSGVRVKILEAMAMGVPVVSTTTGCDGLAVHAGEHLLVADTPVAFAQACAAVLHDRALARHLAEQARRLVLERYDTRVALEALDAAYARALALHVRVS
jgi:glycosyltransferase involved in cell wall biosynthesis